MAKRVMPAQRTLQLCKKLGALAGSVERWNPYVGEHGIRQDLWNFADLAVIWPDIPGTHYINATSASAVNAHINKFTVDPVVSHKVRLVLRAGNSVSVVGWRHLANGRWQPRVRHLMLDPILNDGTILISELLDEIKPLGGT